MDIPEEQKVKLRMMFSTLDPIILLGRIELIQSELLQLAKTAQAVPQPLLGKSVPSPTSPHLISLDKPKPAKKLRRKPPGTHLKKGRKPMFSDHMLQTAHELLKANSLLKARQLMEALNKKYPGSLIPPQKQTLYRIIRQWREAHPEC